MDNVIYVDFKKRKAEKEAKKQEKLDIEYPEYNVFNHYYDRFDTRYLRESSEVMTNEEEVLLTAFGFERDYNFKDYEIKLGDSEYYFIAKVGIYFYLYDTDFFDLNPIKQERSLKSLLKHFQLIKNEYKTRA